MTVALSLSALYYAHVLGCVPISSKAMHCSYTITDVGSVLVCVHVSLQAHTRTVESYAKFNDAAISLVL